MAEVKRIRVITKFEQPTTATIFLRNFLFWGFLVGAEGGSRMWFGGSWVIDVMIVAIVVVWVIVVLMRTANIEADMTTDEIRRWVAAGAPLEVREWRAAQETGLGS